jgi:hypothetical protein
MVKEIKKQKSQKMAGYDAVLKGVAGLLESARRASARAANAIMTATYWEIGRRIVEHEVKGRGRAEYGKQLIDNLSEDLTTRFGRGFGRSNLFQIHSFYIAYSEIVQTVSGQFKKPQIIQTASGKSCLIAQTLSAQLSIKDIADRFPLPWSFCAQKDHAVAHYALEGLPNKVLAAEYRTVLPDERALAAEVERTRRLLEERAALKIGRRGKQ